MRDTHKRRGRARLRRSRSGTPSRPTLWLGRDFHGGLVRIRASTSASPSWGGRWRGGGGGVGLARGGGRELLAEDGRKELFHGEDAVPAGLDRSAIVVGGDDQARVRRQLRGVGHHLRGQAPPTRPGPSA